jgi:hypothetical protein
VVIVQNVDKDERRIVAIKRHEIPVSIDKYPTIDSDVFFDADINFSIPAGRPGTAFGAVV